MLYIFCSQTLLNSALLLNHELGRTEGGKCKNREDIRIQLYKTITSERYRFERNEENVPRSKIRFI